jgi:hypothetical protein
MLKKNECVLRGAIFKNTSSPIDRKIGRSIYHGSAQIRDVIKFDNGANIRDYLYNGSGKRSNVQNSIMDTLVTRPEDFNILNGGITIIAKKCEIDDKRMMVKLTEPNIINGAQTQGTIGDYLESGGDENTYVQIEVLIFEDEELAVETTISRNNQHKVQAYGIATKRGYFDDLVAIMEHNGHTFKTKEHEDNGLDHILQLVKVLIALTPQRMLDKVGFSNKVACYSRRATCLKFFEKIYMNSSDKKSEQYQDSVTIYNCWFDIAPTIWETYLRWKSHNGFYGTRLHCIERNGSDITSVPDGLIFPIVSALSQFVKRRGDTYSFEYDDSIDEDLIDVIKDLYTSNGSNPPSVGRSSSAYSTMNSTVKLLKKHATA